MSESAATAEVLGLRARKGKSMSPLTLLGEVEHGLPLSALDRVARAVAPRDASFAFRLVPKATLARRRQQAGRLTAEEGARAARLADIWAFAREVWGEDEAARAFLFRAHAMLDGRRPIDVVLASEFGKPLVDSILGGLLYGTAA